MKKTLLLISLLLTILGCLLLFGDTTIKHYIYEKPLLEEQKIVLKEENRNEIKKQIQKNKKDSVDKKDVFDFENVKSIELNELRNAKLNQKNLIGIIYVPSVNIKLPILYGATHENMLVGAGTLKSNQKMGDGNYSIASHNHPNPNILFAPIRNINNGDIMYMTDYENVYLYKMKLKEVIEPTRIDVIEDVENKSLLTLVSCYSPDGHDRIFVTGELFEIKKFDDMSLEWREKLLL